MIKPQNFIVIGRCHWAGFVRRAASWPARMLVQAGNLNTAAAVIPIRQTTAHRQARMAVVRRMYDANPHSNNRKLNKK